MIRSMSVASQTFLILGLIAALAGCDRGERAPAEQGATRTAAADEDAELAAAEQRVGTVSVDELASLLAAKRAQAIDANGAPTRSRMGVVPGATLLSSYRQYAMSELPADKATKLVFYCANEQCGASHHAAARAVRAGWTDVAVMSAGIAGWRNAGKPTDQRL